MYAEVLPKAGSKLVSPQCPGSSVPARHRPHSNLGDRYIVFFYYFLELVPLICVVTRTGCVSPTVPQDPIVSHWLFHGMKFITLDLIAINMLCFCWRPSFSPALILCAVVSGLGSKALDFSCVSQMMFCNHRQWQPSHSKAWKAKLTDFIAMKLNG